MHSPDFHQTAMGRDYFDRTMPKLASAMEKLAESQPAVLELLTAINGNLSRIADALESKDTSQ